MLEIYIKLLPVFGFFTLGLVLRLTRLVEQRHGALLLRIMFFITLPILILIKLSDIQIGIDKVYLPLMNIIINLGCMSTMFLMTKNMQIERQTLGVMLVSSMIINNIFMFPFILTVLGNEAFTDAVIFDIGNGIMTMSLTYAVAFRYGPGNAELKTILLNIVRLPVVWALVLAIVMNLNAIDLPPSFITVFGPVGNLTSPFILVALGIYFTPKMVRPGLIAMIIIARMVIGLLLGFGLASLFNLQGQTFAVVVLCAAAPIGFNALTYASLAKLDMDFASSAMSMSLLIGILTIPLMMYFVQ